MTRTRLALMLAMGLTITATTAPAQPDSVGPIVQVRDYPHSSEVTIVAWAPTDMDYGLRAMLRRDGALIRDHQFYVSTFFGVTFSQATRVPSRLEVVETVAPSDRVLKTTGVSRDVYACFYGSCSPFETRGVRVPDNLLRANRDSLAVRLYGRGGGELVLTLHRDVIDAYLAKVDSVSAALRTK
jgi:hypothetical protein